MKAYYQLVTCSICGTERKIRRNYKTPDDHSFWCNECHKEVEQDHRKVLTSDVNIFEFCVTCAQLGLKHPSYICKKSSKTL